MSLRIRIMAAFATLLALLSITLLVAGCGGQNKLSPSVSEVVDSKEFQSSTWAIKVADLESGDVLESMNPESILDPASTTKLFTCATGLEVLGADYRFDTPVYATSNPGAGGTLDGDLILVASGDLALGGRNAVGGEEVQYTSADHTDANALGNAFLTEGDPLAGLDALAAQAAQAGVRRVDGDVVIDARLFSGRPFNPEAEYGLTPIMVNDNLIDLSLKPTSAGDWAELSWRPQTSMYTVQNKVMTATRGGDTEIEARSGGPGVIVVEGQVPEGSDPVVHTYTVEDPEAFARTLFIEALGRAGVQVTSPQLGPNRADRLPDGGAYAGLPRLANLESPPFKEYVKLVLKVSHNPGADTVLLLVAVHEGKSTMADGLQIERAFLDKAGVDTGAIVINDGQGAIGANLISPEATVQLLRYMNTTKDAKAYRDALPIAGVDGSLAIVLTKSPAKGKIQAKTGTHLGPNTLDDSALLTARALGGYMKTSGGRQLVFTVNVNNVPIKGMEDLLPMMEKHAGIMEKLYEEY
jgi:PBP4 family serine-type D-alanyl-D-alanine carboxypeptidase